jgi:hypothetical protein
MRYDLWDVESGNSLGTYESEDEALAVVRTLIAHFGPRYADVLDLGSEDDHGNARLIASGAALTALAMAAVEPSVGSRRARG